MKNLLSDKNNCHNEQEYFGGKKIIPLSTSGAQKSVNGIMKKKEDNIEILQGNLNHRPEVWVFSAVECYNRTIIPNRAVPNNYFSNDSCSDYFFDY